MRRIATNTIPNSLLTEGATAGKSNLQCPLFKSILAFRAHQQKTKNKIIGGDFIGFSPFKPTTAANCFYNRLIKELIKVFFTLLLKLQFVDIVKCVKNYKLLFLYNLLVVKMFSQC